MNCNNTGNLSSNISVTARGNANCELNCNSRGEFSEMLNHISLAFIVLDISKRTEPDQRLIRLKRELVALLGLSSWCLVMIVWLFFTVPYVCLRLVIVVFPDQTHYFCAVCSQILILKFECNC